MDSKKKDIIKILVILGLLFFLLVPVGCNTSGLAILGYELNPSDSVSYFATIVDQDSVKHKFKRPIMENSDNWCYEHAIWEDVRKGE